MKAEFTIDNRRIYYDQFAGAWFFVSREGLRGPFHTRRLADVSLEHLRRHGHRRSDNWH